MNPVTQTSVLRALLFFLFLIVSDLGARLRHCRTDHEGQKETARVRRWRDVSVGIGG
jgi:hypothetical protein